MIYFVAFTILLFSLSKEYLILNQEIIIYITFLTLLVLAIYSFKFLTTTFDNTRQDYIKILQNTTSTLQTDLQSSYNKSNYFSDLLISSYELSLPYETTLRTEILEHKLLTFDTDEVEDNEMLKMKLIMTK